MVGVLKNDANDNAYPHLFIVKSLKDIIPTDVGSTA
jgi:hypothetical protein